MGIGFMGRPRISGSHDLVIRHLRRGMLAVPYQWGSGRLVRRDIIRHLLASSLTSRASAVGKSVSCGIDVEIVDHPVPVPLQEPDPERGRPALELGPGDITP